MNPKLFGCASHRAKAPEIRHNVHRGRFSLSQPDPHSLLQQNTTYRHLRIIMIKGLEQKRHQMGYGSKNTTDIIDPAPSIARRMRQGFQTEMFTWFLMTTSWRRTSRLPKTAGLKT